MQIRKPLLILKCDVTQHSGMQTVGILSAFTLASYTKKEERKLKYADISRETE